MKAWVCRSTTFDAAHFLPNYEGKCKYLHGHTYTVEIGVYGDISESSWIVMDLTLIGEFLKSVEREFDHTLINTTLTTPTAECIAVHIWRRFKTRYDYLKLDEIRVRVWETPDSYVEVLNAK